MNFFEFVIIKNMYILIVFCIVEIHNEKKITNQVNFIILLSRTTQFRIIFIKR